MGGEEVGGLREVVGGFEGDGVTEVGGESETVGAEAGDVERGGGCWCSGPRGGGTGRGLSRCCFWIA